MDGRVEPAGQRNRFLDWVERVGNALPDPIFIFVIIIAVLVGTVDLADDLVASVQAEFSAAEAVELIAYLLRNSANKVAVAFGADAAIVDEGFEYQSIDADGETLTVEAPASR